MNRDSQKFIFDRLAKFAVLLVMLLLPALFGASWTVAQESSAMTADELEEIIVVAPRTFTSMRAEIVRTEDRALGLFNELNEDDDYDIVCRNETPTGSHIPERVCRPVYVMRLEARAAQDFILFGVDMAPVEDPAYHDRILRKKLEELASENPSLLEALQDYYDAKTTYDTARAERFGSNQDSP